MLKLFLFCSLFFALPAQASAPMPDQPDPSMIGSSDPDEIEEYMHEWPKFLDPIYRKFKSSKSYLVVLTIPPDYPFDFTSGEKLKQSMRYQGFGRGHIGHNLIGWSCADGGDRLDGMVAQTGESQQQVKQMVMDGWGAGALLATFTDGIIQTPAHMNGHFHDLMKKKMPFVLMTFEVPTHECHAARNFVSSYIHHPRRPARLFGLQLNPNRFEGAGCGSFVGAILSQADSLRSTINLMYRNLTVPEHIFGAGLPVPPETIPYVLPKFKGRTTPWRMPMKDFLEKNWDARGGVPIRIFDPEMFYLFFQTVSSNFASTAGHAPPIRKVNYFEPKPGQAPWRKIDGSFDSKAQQVVEAAKAWSRRQKAEGFRLDELSLPARESRAYFLHGQ